MPNSQIAQPKAGQKSPSGIGSQPIWHGAVRSSGADPKAVAAAKRNNARYVPDRPIWMIPSANRQTLLTQWLIQHDTVAQHDPIQPAPIIICLLQDEALVRGALIAAECTDANLITLPAPVSAPTAWLLLAACAAQLSAPKAAAQSLISAPRIGRLGAPEAKDPAWLIYAEAHLAWHLGQLANLVQIAPDRARHVFIDLRDARLLTDLDRVFRVGFFAHTFKTQKGHLAKWQDDPKKTDQTTEIRAQRSA